MTSALSNTPPRAEGNGNAIAIGNQKGSEQPVTDNGSGVQSTSARLEEMLAEVDVALHELQDLIDDINHKDKICHGKSANGASGSSERVRALLKQISVVTSKLETQTNLLREARLANRAAPGDVQEESYLEKRARLKLQEAAARVVEAQRSGALGSGDSGAEVQVPGKMLSTREIFAELVSMSSSINEGYMKRFENAAYIYQGMLELFNNAAATASKNMRPLADSGDDKKEAKTGVHTLRIERAIAAVIEKYFIVPAGTSRPFTKETLKDLKLKPEFDLYSGDTRAKAEEWAKNFGLQVGKPGEPSAVIVQRGDKWCVTMDMGPVLRFYDNIPGLDLHRPYSIFGQEVWTKPEDFEMTVLGKPANVGIWLDTIFSEPEMENTVRNMQLPGLNAAMLQAWQSSNATDKETANGTVQLLADKLRNAATIHAQLNRMITSTFQMLIEADKAYLAF